MAGLAALGVTHADGDRMTVVGARLEYGGCGEAQLTGRVDLEQRRVRALKAVGEGVAIRVVGPKITHQGLALGDRRFVCGVSGEGRGVVGAAQGHRQG